MKVYLNQQMQTISAKMSVASCCLFVIVEKLLVFNHKGGKN